MGTLRTNDGSTPTVVMDLDLNVSAPEYVLDLLASELGARTDDIQIVSVDIAFRTTANLANNSTTSRDITFVKRDAIPTVDVDHVVEKIAASTAADVTWVPDSECAIPGTSGMRFVLKFTQVSTATARIHVTWKYV